MSLLKVAILMCVFGCGAHSEPADIAAPVMDRPAFSGLVDVGDGRSMFLETRGAGPPTVVFLSGRGVGAADWSEILAPGDAAHVTPADDVSAGLGTFVKAQEAVYPSVAKFALVAAYDRPDVRFEGGDLTTPRPQPHSVEVDVSDLHALLTASGLPGPYVLVAHSYGGFLALLYARRYPDSVVGLVMVDAATEVLEEAMGPDKLAKWDEQSRGIDGQQGERVELIDAIARIKSAPPLPKVPTVILSADKPYRFDLLPPELQAQQVLTFEDWLAGQDLMAAALGVKHVKATQSGHHIYLYSPKLVVEAIRDVVGQVRASSTTLRLDPTE